VEVAFLLPFTNTVTPGKGLPSLDVTTPLMGPAFLML
jgi:hypothetical protein